MLEGGQRENTTLHFNRGHIFGFKFFRRKVIGLPGIDLRAAGEDIERSKIIFGPGMDRQMRFRDDDHSGNSMRVKRVKDHIDNAGFGDFGRLDHHGFDFVDVVENFGVALVEFDQEVASE